jgi:hypothetical protein
LPAVFELDLNLPGKQDVSGKQQAHLARRTVLRKRHHAQQKDAN